MQIGEKIVENLPALPSLFNFSSSVESLRQCRLDIAKAILRNSGEISVAQHTSRLLIRIQPYSIASPFTLRLIFRRFVPKLKVINSSKYHHFGMSYSWLDDFQSSLLVRAALYKMVVKLVILAVAVAIALLASIGNAYRLEINLLLQLLLLFYFHSLLSIVGCVAERVKASLISNPFPLVQLPPASQLKPLPSSKISIGVLAI